MKKGQTIKTVTLHPGSHVIRLDRIYPLKPIASPHLQSVSYWIDDAKQNSTYANRLEIEMKEKDTIDITTSEGYLAAIDSNLSNRFLFDRGWSGGDGIFTFNLTDGKDGFDQNEPKTTLFVFGDTFVGTSDPETKRRLQPHLMPNNSLAYMDKKGDLSFKLNWRKNGSIGNFFNLDPVLDREGTIPANLVTYDRKEKNPGWLSGYDPESIELVFDLFKTRTITHITFQNYYNDELNDLNKRGIKTFKLFASDDHASWDEIGQYALEKSRHKGDEQTIEVEMTSRYVKLVIDPRTKIGNHNDEMFDEGLFGLDRISFHNKKQRYRDVFAATDTTLLEKRMHSWIWLQDGVVIGKNLYFIPIVITGDSTQPEGLQFKVLGAALFKVPIENEHILPERTTQKKAPLLIEDETSNTLFGCAIMNNSQEKDFDGYVYIYGYKTTMGLRELLVARVEPENFESFDDWRFYDGATWSSDLLDAAPILSHVSPEMSVSRIKSGTYKDLYLAVFTYDTDTRYVAFSHAENPWGPFQPPQKIYRTPEQDIFKSTTYTYNAKAHPHLSKSEDILVSYNTNTYSYAHNMSDYRIYRPRFIRLIDTGKK